MQDRLFPIQQHYQAQFTVLDVTIDKMNSTSTFLTQQPAYLEKIA